MFELRPILKTYYDALEEGKILGMKCEECGDVVWPPLPTCQKCGSTELNWIDMGHEAIIDEIRYEDSSVGGDYTFRKANDYFVNKEPYCICVGHFQEGTRQFHAALYGVTKDNVDELISKLPFNAKVEFIQMDGGFKSVGFRVKD
ncbi:zinc ribbon domain-containing protein [Clostridium estertheticum]|uniref:Zn-ribbon domain-containing OB-fold protein n=1 Tax=Clostridium estertheticum TaxID=238834 RepID=UPI0013E90C92|nr:zinc ribbon domain-containing protein [Clostridium estertheticum]MBZ9685217.1 zinc ribbon domain-containing protein [Clostridium estertheticum]